jgi:hypothetical protein
MKRLVCQGALLQVQVQEPDQWYVADTVADDTDTSALSPLQQGSIVYRIAFGPRAMKSGEQCAPHQARQNQNTGRYHDRSTELLILVFHFRRRRGKYV